MTKYSDMLDGVVETALSIPGTGGYRALQRIVNELDSPTTGIGHLLYSLDRFNFNRVINLLIEFRNSGRRENFDILHFNARSKINLGSDDN